MESDAAAKLLTRDEGAAHRRQHRQAAGVASQARRAASCRQLIEQGLSLLQIERIEPFGEPAVDRSEKRASLLALVTPEPHIVLTLQGRRI